jgi:hypothetical protein
MGRGRGQNQNNFGYYDDSHLVKNTIARNANGIVQEQTGYTYDSQKRLSQKMILRNGKLEEYVVYDYGRF